MAKKTEATLLLRIKEQGAEALGKIGDGFSEIKEKAAIASAAITAALGFAVKSYGESEEASMKLALSVRNQGLDVDVLTTRYDALATAIMKKTDLDDDEIKAAIAAGQTMAGNIALTDELIRATTDYAVATGTDLNSAFEKVGKSIGTSTNALARDGIVLDENAPKVEKMAEITRILTGRFEDQAEVMSSSANGAVRQMYNAIGELAEAVGSHLAPFVESAARQITTFINAVAENETLVKFGTVAAVAAAAITGLIAAIGGGVAIAAFLTAIAPVVAALSGILIPVAAIGGAIVALRIAWMNDFGDIQSITFGTFEVIKKIFDTLSENVMKQFGGMKDIIAGAFSLDVEQIKSGIEQISSVQQLSMEELKAAYKQGFDERKAKVQEALDAEEAAEAKALEKSSTSKKAAWTEQSKFALQKKQEELAKKAEEERKAAEKEFQLWVDQLEAKAQEEIKAREKAEAEAKDAREKEAEEYEEFMRRLGEATRSFITGGFEDLSKYGTELFVNDFIPGFGGAAGAMFSLLAQDTDKFMEQINKIFSVEFINNIITNIPLMFEAIIDKLPEVVEALITTLIANSPKIAVALATALTDPGFYEALVNAIGNGFANGTHQGLMNLSDIIGDALEKAWNDVKGMFEIKIGGGGGDDKEWYEFSKGGSVPGYAAGGTVAPIYAAGGMMIPRGTDTVPAMLTPGEFVVNASAARRNRGALESMNAGGGGGGTTVVMNVYGGLLGDEFEARKFAMAVDAELLKLRQLNQSVAFD